jgi:hypothetical protein
VSRTLTRKQVIALSRALKRRGRKLPKKGMCAIFKRPGGSKTVEVCHDKNGYYVVSGLRDRLSVDARREEYARSGKKYTRVNYDDYSRPRRR